MNQEQAFKKVIEQAVKNGWYKDKIKSHKYKINSFMGGYSIVNGVNKELLFLGNKHDIIFNKSFLKAYFGEHWELLGFRLMISDDRIEYLKKFLEV